MANGERWYSGRGKWWSYKRTTFIVCLINISIALYVLHCLYTSLYIYPFSDGQDAVKYSPDQISKMEESILIRKASEPKQLVKLVKEIKKRFLSEESTIELPQHLKRKITDDILEMLRGLNGGANVSEQREAVESWRREKLKEAKQLKLKRTLNLTDLPDDAGVLARALKSNWSQLLEEIGLWMPIEIDNVEHDDKPEGAKDFDIDILPGRPLPFECHAELHTDYGGAAVKWGHTHHKESAYDCCQACMDHTKQAKPGENTCNIWVYCPSEKGCHSPDIYEHKHMTCWLKYAENPWVSFKDKYPQSYKNVRPGAPDIVPWVSGVIRA